MNRAYLCLRDSGFQLRRLNYSLYKIIKSSLRPLIKHFHKRLAYQKYYNPTVEMEREKEFFESNQNIIRINNIKNMLEDEESRLVFDTMIEFRCTQDYRLFSRIANIDVNKQYFDNDFFTYSDGECLVDCGAFDGDTIESFRYHMKALAIKDYSVVAFEPDGGNCERLIKNQKDVIAINSGVWNEDTTLHFMVEGNAFTHNVDINDASNSNAKIEAISVKKIDSCRECDNATIIKMDIEGAEMNALQGAKNLIRTKRPKLAICIYHSAEDMLRIAEWIKSTVPEYRLWIRQHSDTQCETVLYAMI